MIKELKANLMFFLYDHRFTISVFWSIFLVTSTIMFLIAYLSSNVQMGLSLEGAVYIFCGIAGFLTTKETFPYLIKLGSTRNMYVVSTMVFHVLLALFMSVVGLIILQFVNSLYPLLGVENFHVFSVLDGTTLAQTWYNMLWFNTLICFLLLIVGTLLGSIFYRFGSIGGMAGLIVFIFLFIIPTSRSVVLDMFVLESGFPIQFNYVAMTLLAISFGVPLWLILKKASTAAGVTR